MIKCILWDFDGVILDSMKVRDTGFVKIFQNYPKHHVDELLKYHRKNGGLSRYVKIKHFYNNILGEEISQEKIMELAENFSIIMKAELTSPKLLIGKTLSFIESNYKKTPFHIVSGSDGQELRFLCKELGISQYFITIDGSPTPKKDLVQSILNEYNYNLTSTCLIGDSINDFEAANENGIMFFGFNNTNLKKDSHIYIEEYNAIEKLL